jgi:F-type H+-transporting ATPase subunit epsilon
LAKSTFRCKLVTPEAQVLDNPVTQVILPVWDGKLGVLPGRAPMVMELGTGELRVDFPDDGQTKGGSRHYFLADGFVQMVNNELTILAAYAAPADKLSETDAQAELASLNARRTEGMTEAERVRHAKERSRAEGKLRAARAFKAAGVY